MRAMLSALGQKRTWRHITGIDLDLAKSADLSNNTAPAQVSRKAAD